MNKPKIQNLRQRIHAAAFKPAYLRTPTEGIIVFVTPAGQEIHMRAAPQVWATAYGTPQPGDHHSGLDMRTDDQFIVCTRDVNGIQMAVAVHCFPKHEYLPSSTPVLREGDDKDLIYGVINLSTGEIVIRRMPLHLKLPSIMNILRAIDDRERLDIGDVLTEGGVKVQNIMGNEFRLSSGPAAVTPKTTTLGAVMQETMQTSAEPVSQ